MSFTVAQFIGGPHDGVVEGFPRKYDQVRMLIEEDLPLVSYAQYARSPRPGEDGMSRYIYDDRHVFIEGVDIPGPHGGER